MFAARPQPSNIVKAFTLEEALDSAASAIEASGFEIASPLRQAMAFKLEADEAEKAGDVALAIEKLSEMVAVLPPALLQPSQPPLEPEALCWANTGWEENLFGSSLAFGASAADDDFGKCKDGMRLHEVTVDEAERALRGRWEQGDQAGEFELVMSADGRRFIGQLADGEGGSRVWEGMRKGTGTGMRRRRRGAAPDLKLLWLHSALLSRGRMQLAAGKAEEARNDARAATTLCCRTASGWKFLSEAAEACGDAEEAKCATHEAAWLESFA